MKNVMKESKLKVPVPPNNENYPSKETSKVNLTTQTTKIEDKKQQQQTKNFKLRAPKQEEKPKKTYKKKTTKKQNDIQTNNIKKYFSTTTETNKQQVETVQNENVTRTHVPNIEKENIRSMAAVIRSPITDDGVKSNLQISDQNQRKQLSLLSNNLIVITVDQMTSRSDLPEYADHKMFSVVHKA